MQTSITYFDKPGPANTEATLRLARERADALGIRQVVVASTGGETALKAVEVFRGYKVIAVGIATGPHYHDREQKVVQSFSQEARQRVEAEGGAVLISTHVFGALTHALTNQLGWKASPVNLIAAALRIFGFGAKVACEISMMAADAGLLSTTEEAVAIAGRGRGADTAIVLQPVNSPRFFDLRVKEIICKPRQS
ncbi:MAG: hypothetical protein C4555_05290 [Dehalococcoidia bacterium]|nr:MAG: hypothetical protein C4555_05290 [Dehalococcoidia bacterium]